MQYLCYGLGLSRGFDSYNCLFSMYKSQIKQFTLVLFILFGVMGNLFAQNSSEDYKQISIERAMSLISQKYKLNFSYSSDLIDITKKINLNLNKKNLESALEEFSENAGVAYRILNNQIILSPKKKTNANYYIHGYVRDLSTHEVLPDILIYCSANNNAVYTNKYGYYYIEVPQSAELIELQARIIGYKLNKKTFANTESRILNWDLETSIELNAIEISDTRIEDKTFHKSLISDNIDKDVRERTPRLLGEKDALASARYFAGVNRETDISSGYNIRGGRNDQNLIILDDAPLYHSFHLFGLYSIFNEDALKQMDIIKSGFPARYGGRLSSVVEMITKDGDMQNFHTEVGTGIIASKASVEGPIIKDKLAFFVSGRTSHVNRLLAITNDDSNMTYQFYDVNAKLQYRINDKHKLYASVYKGLDRFKGGEDGSSTILMKGLGWGNESATLRWNHLFHPKWFANTTLIYSKYDFTSDNSDSTIQLVFNSGIKDYSLKYDLDYFHNKKHHFKMGATIAFHEFKPSETYTTSTGMQDESDMRYKNEEFAIYIEDEISLNDKLSMNIGLRQSGYKYRSTLDLNLEPRFLATYLLNSKYAVKLSYGRMYQYSHYLNSITGIGLPTDLWLPSTDQLLPEISDQYTLGLYFNNKKSLRFNIEGFYKYQQDILAYANNTNFMDLIFNAGTTPSLSWAERTMSGDAKIYGIETQFDIRISRLRILNSYTLSYAKNYFDELEYGQWFWANNDRRHNYSIMTSYNITKAWTLVANWVFTTGTPFTLPEGNYFIDFKEPGNLGPGGSFGGNQIFAYDYKGINTYRMSSYHRLDININYVHKFAKSEFEMNVGAMNVYNRKNSLFYTLGYDEKSNANVLKRTSFLGIVPSLTLNFRF